MVQASPTWGDALRRYGSALLLVALGTSFAHAQVAKKDELTTAPAQLKAAAPIDFSAEEAALKQQAKEAFLWSDFDEIERLNRLHLSTDASVLSPYVRMRAVRHGLTQLFQTSSSRSDAYFAELQALTLEWTHKHPKSAIAHILHAQALSSRGWAFRGDGYANTVSPENWREFRRYSERAAQYLRGHSAVAFTDSTAHFLMVRIGNDLGLDKDTLWSIAQDGLKIHPHNESLYFVVLGYLIPKWGGSAKAVDEFIQEVVRKTQPQKGLEMYARLYSDASSMQFKHELFRESYADWQRMNQGFKDWYQQQGLLQTVNAWAYFACMAKDRATLQQQLDLMGQTPPMQNEWGSNPSRNFASCKEWATQL